VTVTGCLQKGDGGTFIVTAINSPRVSVGTSGSGASATAVEREQVRAAEHAYRLDGSDDKTLDALVGHQVRVRGTIEERSDLPTQARAEGGANQTRSDRPAADAARKSSADEATAGQHGTAATSGERDPLKIDESDLAKINVAAIDRMADACGSGSSRR